MDEYPGGRERLDRSINGGELFQTFLYNPVSTARHGSSAGHLEACLIGNETDMRSTLTSGKDLLMKILVIC